MDAIVSIVLVWCLLIVSIPALVLHLLLRILRMEVSRSIPDMLSAALKLSEENTEERNNLLRRVVALWDLGMGDAVGSCQSLPQKMVPVFVELFKVNSTPCSGWRQVIYDRHH